MSKTKPVHHLETIAPGRVASILALATSDPMEMILRPEYFDKYATYGLRKHDCIMVVANMHEDEVEYGWLRVVSVADGIITVKKADAPCVY